MAKDSRVAGMRGLFYICIYSIVGMSNLLICQLVKCLMSYWPHSLISYFYSYDLIKSVQDTKVICMIISSESAPCCHLVVNVSSHVIDIILFVMSYSILYAHNGIDKVLN